MLTSALSIVALLACNDALAIRGGSPSAQSWVVRVINVVDNQQTEGCTGAAVTPQIVVTAQHCNAKAVVFKERSVLLESVHDVPGTQARLLVLATPIALDQYARLGRNFMAAGATVGANTIGIAYGYGPRADGVQRSIGVKVRSHRNTKDGEVFNVASIDGAFERGDSGGPLIIDGEVVGVLWGAEAGGDATSVIFDGLSLALEPIVAMGLNIRAQAFIASEL
ncbi:trypsin-like serine protease [Pseudomonas sp. TE3786]